MTQLDSGKKKGPWGIIAIIALTVLVAFVAVHFKPEVNNEPVSLPHSKSGPVTSAESIPEAKPSDSAMVTISTTEYEDLKKKAESLPSQLKHNEHMAGSNTDLIKENLELKTKVDACNADKDVKNVQAIVLLQDSQINKFRNEALELQEKLKKCSK
jgi:cell shape-determining protein MreC